MHVKLKVLRGSSAGKEIAVRVPKFLIGRAEDCQLRANSDALSRKHCVISVSEREVTIRDLGSRNGTFVNGTRIENEQRIQIGDQLRIGPLEFLVTFATAQAAPNVDKSKSSSSSGVHVVGGDEMAGMISDWLSEADEVDRRTRVGDVDTRAMRMDETEQIQVVKDAGDAANKQEAEGNNEAVDQPTPVPESPASDLPTATFTKRTSTRQAAPKDTQEAAAQTLRKFFNRGS